MADVEQMKKIVPFVTCEITFSQSVCELMFGINVSFRHCIRAKCRTEMDNIEQAQQMIPLITCEITFSQNVCELMFGINVSNLIFENQ